MQHDTLSLDIFWLKDESLEDTEDLPDPDVLAQEIMEKLESAQMQFEPLQRLGRGKLNKLNNHRR